MNVEESESLSSASTNEMVSSSELVSREGQETIADTDQDGAHNELQAGLLAVLREYWGYEQFRPLQQEAMSVVCSGKDSVVVLPTGGGKSLCYQVPAMYLDGMTVVVSPLISLMKDQVDGLRACGIEADFLNSSLSMEESRKVRRRVLSGRTKLLYVAPERLAMDSMLSFLAEVKLAFVAVDEAHCISAWGHDFRPEYRQLLRLREIFPQLPIHAYTATATEKVRTDIEQQLQLRDSHVLVGSFDRPNLSYRLVRRRQRIEQICQVIDRNAGESGIVYCISRSDVDSICESLVKRGCHAVAYHAGLSDEERKQRQDDFIKDRANVIVATVAFGMGIDKPDVRYVIHAGMPKSIENYQQETGRAGRDGLESECVLFYSGHDFHVWNSMIQSSGEGEQAVASLVKMYDLCTSVRCRHQALVEYFGQTLEQGACQACDVCLGELSQVEDGLVLAQKIISCVARLKERYGADYTSQVLIGSTDRRIQDRHHDQLSTYALLSEFDRTTIRNWVEQLVDQGYLAKEGEYNVLRITMEGREVLRGNVTPVLLEAPQRKGKTSKARVQSAPTWEGVDRKLFDHLRKIRKTLAEESNVPAYVIFDDRTLRELSRVRPSSIAKMLSVKGVGIHKLEKYGELFMDAIETYASENDLTRDMDL